MFSQKVVRFYVAEISIALHFLHSKGIIHRDLKVCEREEGEGKEGNGERRKRGKKNNHLITLSNPPPSYTYFCDIFLLLLYYLSRKIFCFLLMVMCV